MIETLPLFEESESGPRRAGPLPKTLPRRQQRTQERLRAIEDGRHPLTGLPLHPLAPKDTNRSRRKPQAYCCGTCVSLVLVPSSGRAVLDCKMSTSNGQGRRWEPACELYRPRGPSTE